MMSAEAGASANTISAYATDLRLASEALDGGLGDADAAALARLSDGWADLSRSTVARKSSALRRFYAFLAEEGMRDDDPGRYLPRPGSARSLPKILSIDDVGKLFAAIAKAAQQQMKDFNAQGLCWAVPGTENYKKYNFDTRKYKNNKNKSQKHHKVY